MVAHTVEIPAPPIRLAGDLWIPPAPAGLIIFAHCNGTGRLSSRGRQVARALNECGFATLLPDLLTPGEAPGRPGLCDVKSLSKRLLAATQWAMSQPETDGLPVGYLGASRGAAAALCTAAELGDSVRGIVSRGGRPDLCDCLERVTAPTLLIVGADQSVLALNEMTADRLRCPHELREIPGATQVFEEPGAPERVAGLAAAWFGRQFPRPKVSVRTGSARRRRRSQGTASPEEISWLSPDDRRSDWAYIPWARVESKGDSRWLAS
jgi:putative phosphoribosyl transferase